jgi:hypothetical protein
LGAESIRPLGALDFGTCSIVNPETLIKLLSLITKNPGKPVKAQHSPGEIEGD